MRPVALVLVAAVTLGGCGSSGTSGASGQPTTVMVLAAASLTEAFNQIGKDFERANPGYRARFSYGGSSTLAQQIVAGAPADVFASASPVNMKQVTDAGLTDSAGPFTFTRNQLVIGVPKGNPKGIRSLADLSRPGLRVALCAEQVPCGAAAQRALRAAHVDIQPVTLEQDVKGALAKLRLGEVDAALVYRTDARAAQSDVDGVEFPESSAAVNDYQVVLLGQAPARDGGAAFIAYLKRPEAERVLTERGFERP